MSHESCARSSNTTSHLHSTANSPHPALDHMQSKTHLAKLSYASAPAPESTDSLPLHWLASVPRLALDEPWAGRLFAERFFGRWSAAGLVLVSAVGDCSTIAGGD